MRLPDAYTWRARTLPVIIVCLPALIVLAGSVAWRSSLGVATGLTITVASALASQLGRDRGRRLQAALWQTWGGSPTLQLIRHHGSQHPDRVVRLHTTVREVLGDTLPTATQEQADPDSADAAYEDVIAKLRDRTRDRGRFPLVFEENANYGFRRNLLGLRPWGLGLAIAGLGRRRANGRRHEGNTGASRGALGRASRIGVRPRAVWLFIVKPDWVRIPADAYAWRLFEAIETLRELSEAPA
jgi:hypothetical protein